MTNRIPLIVHTSAQQIQELPSGDSLNGIANITATGTVQAQQLTSTDDATITGEITVSGQPNCLLTNPRNYEASGTANHVGGNNHKPISFANLTTNVGCTTSLASNATVPTAGITSITVPTAGTYLVSGSISGINTSTASGNQTNNKDQVRLCLDKHPRTGGIGTFPNTETFPASVFGNELGEEFNINFTLPLPLAANDVLSLHFSHIGTSKAEIQEGYFSVTKLH